MLEFNTNAKSNHFEHNILCKYMDKYPLYKITEYHIFFFPVFIKYLVLILWHFN